MSLLATALYISSDVHSAVTTTQASVQAANPTLWPLVTQVPPYAYQSFGDIWISSTTFTAASGDVFGRVVYQLGANLEASLGEVTILGEGIESADVRNMGLQENTAGAETMYLNTVLRLPEELQDWNKIVNADLRLRWLLDENWRKARHVPAYIPNLGDYTIGGNVRISWIRHLVPPNAKEVWSQYLLCYDRLVPV